MVEYSDILEVMATKIGTAKAKAADYLQELVDSTDEGWLTTLISCVLPTGSCPKPQVMDRIFHQFLSIHGLAETGVAGVVTPSVKDDADPHSHRFVLKAIKHGTGVNALKNGAELTFHP